MSASASRYFHPSNLVTYLSLLAGLLAIAAARELGSWPLSGALIAFCALADTCDGKFAHLFRRTDPQKAFGVQLDSLTDALTFGLVPVVCLYLLTPFESAWTRAVWSAAAFAYVLSAVTRLGAYNVHHEEIPGFIGLPTTIAGLIWSSVFLAKPSAATSSAVLLACGLAMVAFIPIPRPRGARMAAILAWAVALVIAHGVSLWVH